MTDNRISLPLYAADTGTPAYWRSAGPSYRARTWKGAARRFAFQHGRAVAHLADDGAMVFTRLASGIREKTYTPEQVQWTKEQNND